MSKVMHIVFFFLFVSVFAEEKMWLVIKDGFFYDVNYNPAYKLEKGVLLEPRDIKYGVILGDIGYGVSAFYKDASGLVSSDMVIPVNVKYILQNEILTKDNEYDYIYVNKYSYDILYEKNRDVALNYEERSIKLYEESRSDYDLVWWNSTQRNDNQFLISNVYLSFSGLMRNEVLFMIHDILPYPGGCAFIVKCINWNVNDVGIFLIEQLMVDDIVKLLLIFDGDYVNLYLRNLDNKIGSFAKMDSRTLNQFESLLETNTCDISKIRWPRRADGSSDYDDKRIINPQPGMLYRTAARLRVRSSQDVASDILTTLEKDTKVIVLDNGEEETIDGITSSWVQVELEDGSKGWCFGGFLHGPLVEAVPAPELPVVQYSDTQQETEIEKETDLVEEEPKEVPDYTIPFLGGVGFLILGIVVIVAARKRKKQS